jgi:hypothetical protein
MDETKAAELGDASRKGQESRDLLANGFFKELLDKLEDGYNAILSEMGPGETDNFSHIASKKDTLRDLLVTLKNLDAKGVHADLELSGKKRKKKGLL